MTNVELPALKLGIWDWDAIQGQRILSKCGPSLGLSWALSMMASLTAGQPHLTWLQSHKLAEPNLDATLLCSWNARGSEIVRAGQASGASAPSALAETFSAFCAAALNRQMQIIGR